jgi:tocopherol O-methyltransferase
VIFPNTAQDAAAVAAHYDDLDVFYRDIWGEHVHHGFWATGDETPEAAVEALIDLVAARLDAKAGQAVCDIGCGYGGSAAYLAARTGADITGLTISAAQLAQARRRTPGAGSLTFLQTDWLDNHLPAETFDRAYAIESSEHMPDKEKFFDEAFRTLKPGGRLVICAWLAAEAPRPWEIRHLLEPICREGRLPSMGTQAAYHAMAARSGFAVSGAEDISKNVSRTWMICARRVAGRVFTDSRYIKMLLDASKPNRIFALTLFRLIAAYRTGAMRYCLMVYEKR